MRCVQRRNKMKNGRVESNGVVITIVSQIRQDSWIILEESWARTQQTRWPRSMRKAHEISKRRKYGRAQVPTNGKIKGADKTNGDHHSQNEIEDCQPRRINEQLCVEGRIEENQDYECAKAHQWRWWACEGAMMRLREANEAEWMKFECLTAQQRSEARDGARMKLGHITAQLRSWIHNSAKKMGVIWLYSLIILTALWLAPREVYP